MAGTVGGGSFGVGCRVRCCSPSRTSFPVQRQRGCHVRADRQQAAATEAALGILLALVIAHSGRAGSNGNIFEIGQYGK